MRGELYTESHDQIKNKGATTNLIIDDDECFQCSTTVTLNYEKTKEYQTLSLFIYNSKGINQPSKYNIYITSI